MFGANVQALKLSLQKPKDKHPTKIMSHSVNKSLMYSRCLSELATEKEPLTAYSELY